MVHAVGGAILNKSTEVTVLWEDAAKGSGKTLRNLRE